MLHSFVVWIQDVFVPTVGPLGLFVVAFIDSSFLSVPEINDVLVVTAAARDASTAWIYVAASTIGSLAGCLALWYVGRRGGEAVLVRRFGRERVDQTRATFKKWDVLALAIPAILPPPMPFKIFVLSAGVFGYPLRRFAVTLLVARGLRYAGWALMGAVYGDEALALLRRMDAWTTAHAVPLLVGAAAATVAIVAAFYSQWGKSARRRPDAGGGTNLL
jgi:membrane protein YqaA with SNARE-associated domain